MTLDEFAELEKKSGEAVVRHFGIYWRRIRFQFHRTLFPFQQVASDQVAGKNSWKCFQHAIPENESSNCYLNCLVFDQDAGYVIEKLSKHHRRFLRAALKSDVVLNEIRHPETIEKEGFEVYQSFMKRAAYSFRHDRCRKRAFDRWMADMITDNKALVHGAYHQKKLIALYISCKIGDTVFWKTAINSEQALNLRAPDLILHHYRESVRLQSDIKQIYCGMLATKANVNQFKLRRGARVTAIPAKWSGRPIMHTLCQLLSPVRYVHLIGYDEHEAAKMMGHSVEGR